MSIYPTIYYTTMDFSNIMVYIIMKGAASMLFLIDMIFSVAIVEAFSVPPIALVIVIGIFLLLGIYVLRRIRRKKKKNKWEHEEIPPITKILKNDSERMTELNDTIEPFGFAYEPYQDIFYSIMYPWQREMGYCWLYDEACALLSMIIDCEPITFEYNGRRWLIEFWKGQYGMNTGGEVGIYYTTGFDLNIPGVFNGTFYYCVKDEDRINMYFALRKNGNVIMTRSGHHWWLTGFKLGEFSDPSELSMEIILDLYDYEMAIAFATALQKVGYQEEEYVIQGNRVMVKFDKPHTDQPITRSAVLDHIMQKNNEALCDSYRVLTQGYSNTLDKLDVVSKKDPEIYTNILSLGKPKDSFKAFDTIRNYLNKN